jgi:hypothetical protein
MTMAQLMFCVANEPLTDIRSFAEYPKGWYASSDVRSPRTPMSGTRPVGTAAKVDLEI